MLVKLNERHQKQSLLHCWTAGHICNYKWHGWNKNWKNEKN